MKIKLVDRELLLAAQEKLRESERKLAELQRVERERKAREKKASIFTAETSRVFHAFTVIPPKQKKAKIVPKPKIGLTGLGKLQAKGLQNQIVFGLGSKSGIAQARAKIKLVDGKDPGF